jgi:hypothetical protein
MTIGVGSALGFAVFSSESRSEKVGDSIWTSSTSSITSARTAGSCSSVDSAEAATDAPRPPRPPRLLTVLCLALGGILVINKSKGKQCRGARNLEKIKPKNRERSSENIYWILVRFLKVQRKPESLSFA